MVNGKRYTLQTNEKECFKVNHFINIYRLSPPIIMTTDEIMRATDTVIAVFKMAESLDLGQNHNSFGLENNLESNLNDTYSNLPTKFNIIENVQVSNQLLAYRMEKYQQMANNIVNNNNNNNNNSSKQNKSNQNNINAPILNNQILNQSNNIPNDPLLNNNLIPGLNQLIQNANNNTLLNNNNLSNNTNLSNNSNLLNNNILNNSFLNNTNEEENLFSNSVQNILRNNKIHNDNINNKNTNYKVNNKDNSNQSISNLDILNQDFEHEMLKDMQINKINYTNDDSLDKINSFDEILSKSANTTDTTKI